MGNIGDRLATLGLVACGLLGATGALGPLDGATAVVPRTASTLPAVSAAPPPVPARDVAADDEVDLRTTPAAADAAPAPPVARILDRLAVRHTALSARERTRLAHVIVEASAAHRLDPELVMAVIEVESAGYSLAVSRVGALGLMQLLPSTGEEIAGKQGIPWKGPDTLFDPFVNVRLGTAYLRELADRYAGDVDLALAAYNWGPGRIDRRLRRGARVPSLYIEQVRRAETRYAAIESARS